MADLSPEVAAQLQALESSYADNPGRYFVPFAGLLREAGQPERAEEILRENLKRFPGLSAHVLLGRCLADRGAYQEAANEFQYVLSIDAQNLIALRTLAEMSAATGRADDARRWYEELLSVDPMNGDARAALARLTEPVPGPDTADQAVGGPDGWPGAAEAAGVREPAAGDDVDEWGTLDLPAGGEAAEGGEPETVPEPGAATPAAGTAPAAGFPLLDFGPEADREAADAGTPAAAPSAGTPGPEMVTETMAELYASQGLHDRAAEVYRELIRTRGDDPALRRRLAELEAGSPAGPGEPVEEAPDWLAEIEAGSAEEDAAAEPLPDLDSAAGLPPFEAAGAWEGSDSDSVPAPPGEDDTFEASVSLGFTGPGEPESDQPAGGAKHPGGGHDRSVFDAAAPLDGDGHPPETAAEAAELSADWAAAAAPLDEQEDDGEEGPAGVPDARTMRGYLDRLLRWSAAPVAPAGRAAAEEPGPEVVDEPVQQRESAAGAAQEAPAPSAELPAGPPGEAGGSGGTGPAGSGFSFEEFFGAPPAETSPEGPPPSRDAGGTAPPAPSPAPRPEEPAGAAAEPDGGGDDEDLESFQAWLQSLKR
jgi:tetratricopeptide (TPR) repeat protein